MIYVAISQLTSSLAAMNASVKVKLIVTSSSLVSW